jgi:hypothetical protein
MGCDKGTLPFLRLQEVVEAVQKRHHRAALEVLP